MPFEGEGTLWFLLQRDVLEAWRAAAIESQICLNGDSTVGHCLLNFAVSGPACVEGKMIICCSNTVVPLWQTRSYNIHDWSAGGSDARCGSSLWLSCAVFVSSKVSLVVCCDMQTSLKIINLKMLRGELHSRLVGQDKKRKEGNEVSLTPSGSGCLEQIKEVLLWWIFQEKLQNALSAQQKIHIISPWLFSFFLIFKTTGFTHFGL